MFIQTHIIYIIHSLILNSASYRKRCLGLQDDYISQSWCSQKPFGLDIDCWVWLCSRVHRKGPFYSTMGKEQLLFFSRCAMQMPFLLQPKFTYPGACRVYDFSLFYFCCHVFSRASQPRSQSSLQLLSPGHSQACSPSHPGLLWLKLSHFPSK